MRNQNLNITEQTITLETAKGKFQDTLIIGTSKHNPKLFIITFLGLKISITKTYNLIHAKRLINDIAKNKRFISKWHLAKIEKFQNNKSPYFYSTH